MGLVALVACAPIVGTPLSNAPINACAAGQFPCDRYVVGTGASPQCNIDLETHQSRCEFGRPTFAYTVVVDVPDSSFYAPGRTFAFTNDDLVAQTGAPVNAKCALPDCVQLPALVAVGGAYRVTSSAAAQVGSTVSYGASIPLRVELVPLVTGTTTTALDAGLPLASLRASSRLVRSAKDRPLEASYTAAIPVGDYQRVLYPEAPFDTLFPPVFTSFTVADTFPDDVLLGATGEPNTTALDDEGIPGKIDLRTSTITRKDGLDGWRAWLIDRITRRRVSSIAPLSGVTSRATFHTVGQSQGGGGLRQLLDAVIAPPEDWVAVPRVETPLYNGSGFGFAFIAVPPLPTSPATFVGVVGQGSDTLTAIPSRLSFTSLELATSDLSPATATLKYAAVVNTDDAGRFATVLPQGSYDVTIEPIEGFGFAKMRQTVQIPLEATKLARTFRPPARTTLIGRAMLADGRPLSEAQVLAFPSDVVPVAPAVVPRAARTRTAEDGTFRLEVDQGRFDVMIDPQPGTDFPRVVQIRTITGTTFDIGDVVVAPPARLKFTLKDPSDIGNPIVRALVRVYAEPSGAGPPAIEVGRGTTDASGNVEILLAQQAR